MKAASTVTGAAQESAHGLDPRFWILINPALPVGGYSFSHGVESAVREGWISDYQSSRDWIGSLAKRVLPGLELPLLLRMLHGLEKNCATSVHYWNDIALATRETSELLLEEQEKGRALERLYPALGIAPKLAIEDAGFTAAFAQICSTWQVSDQTAMQGYAWIWYEMLVAAAVKLVPLGHSDGQRLLLEFNATLTELVDAAMACGDDDIGAGTQGLAMLSSGHESHYARLFRS